MSSSLPRIKTLQQINQIQKKQSNKQLKLKFRKLTVASNENGQEEKIIKSNRQRLQSLNSLDRYSTVQQQREIKNQKIHLNLIQRKLLKGTYDASSQTAYQLNGLKQKRDKIRTQMLIRQKQIQKINQMLKQIKIQQQQYEGVRQQHENKIKILDQKVQNQIYKTKLALDQRGVLQNMILIRQNINFTLTKNQNQHKDRLIHLKAALNLIDTELRQSTQKCAQQQNLFNKFFDNSNKLQKQRNQQVNRKRQNITKRRQGETLLEQKSKQYLSQLQLHDRMTQLNQFKQIYNPLLANIFIARFTKVKLYQLKQKYQPYQNYYNQLSLYKSFDKNLPSTMVQRFMRHPVQIIELRQKISDKQNNLSKLQQKRTALKQNYSNINFQLNQTLQKIQDKFGQTAPQHKHKIQNLTDECQIIKQKNLKIKMSILNLLKNLGHKGDHKNNGNISSYNNMLLLSQLIKKQIAQK